VRRRSTLTKWYQSAGHAARQSHRRCVNLPRMTQSSPPPDEGSGTPPGPSDPPGPPGAAPAPSAAHTPPPPHTPHAPHTPPPYGAGYDPYAADDALAAWARARSYALSATPDLAWYKGWYPCTYMPPVARIGREIRATFGEAKVAIVETFTGDLLLQATGEDRHICVFVLSPRLTSRAASAQRAAEDL
jgi:hypothetical protein